MTLWQDAVTALTQTRAWSARRVDVTHPATCLRSPELRPPEYPDLWTFGSLHPEWIAQVIERRAALLADMGEPDGQPRRGRVLCVLQEADTHMGEGEPASRGVIDWTYLPPWDTWFAFLPATPAGVLLAWIPEVLEPLVEDARLVAATEPLAWLDGPLPRDTSAANWSAVSLLLAEAAEWIGKAEERF